MKKRVLPFLLFGLVFINSTLAIPAEEDLDLYLEHFTSHPVYIDQNGIFFSRHLIVRFNRKVTLDDQPIDERDFNDVFMIADDQVATVLDYLKTEYVEIINIEKYYLNAVYGDTISIHIRTGEEVIVSDDSLVFVFFLGKLFPLNQAHTILDNFTIVAYSEGPEIIIPTSFLTNFDFPEQASLKPNYPNPFNPSTIIPVELQSAGHIRLEIFDIHGRKVKVVADNFYRAGHHEFRFHASELASGVYIYMITANKFIEQRRMLLLK